MKLINFSFKREPVWMLILSLAPAAAGVLVIMLLLAVKFLRLL